jgi:hypothetical protein
MTDDNTATHLEPLPNPPKPLPQKPGPKLAPFTRTARAVIQFVEELGDPGRDKDSRVWKVKVNGKDPFYALKMVCKTAAVAYHCRATKEATG